MKLQWLGHSAFRLIESTGTAIITDPFETQSVGYSMAYLNADAVTVSHPHSGHNYIAGVKGKPSIIESLGAHDVKGIQVQSIGSFHDDLQGGEKGENLIFKFRLDGVTVCHLGDIGEICSADLIEELIPVNVLLIPVGGNFTIDAEQAKEFVDKIMPDVVIPMHFKTKQCEMDIDKVDSFVKLFDDEEVIVETSDTIEFDRYDFNGESTKILIPKRYKG